MVAAGVSGVSQRDHILSKGLVVFFEKPESLCFNGYVNNPLLCQMRCFRREGKHPYLMILFYAIPHRVLCYMAPVLLDLRLDASTCTNLGFNVADYHVKLQTEWSDALQRQQKASIIHNLLWQMLQAAD